MRKKINKINTFTFESPFVFGKKIEDTFQKINTKICEKENILPWTIDSFPENHNYITNAYDHLILNSFFTHLTDYDKRFDYIKKLLENTFYYDEHKEMILNVVFKIMKTYNGFKKLYKIYKWKSAKKYEENYDLCLNDISNFKNSTKIQLLENNTIYTFRISDLLKIINNALTNNCDMFAEPLQIRNPFTNKEFSLHNLYNIYFKLKCSNYKFPFLFHLLYLENFNIDKFLFNNEEKIREETVKNYFNGLQNNRIKKIFFQMKSKYKKICKITCDKDFPEDIFIKAIKPFVYCYLEIKYTLNKYKRGFLRRELVSKLHSFTRKNPAFGRKVYKINKTNKKTIEFNCEYIPYNKLTSNVALYNDYDNDDESDNDIIDDDSSDDDDNVTIIVSSHNNNNNNENENNNNENNIDNLPIINHINNLSYGQLFEQHYISNNDISYNNITTNDVSYNNITSNDDIRLFEAINDNIQTIVSSSRGTTNLLSPYSDASDESETNLDDDDDEEEIRPFPYNYDSH